MSRSLQLPRGGCGRPGRRVRSASPSSLIRMHLCPVLLFLVMLNYFPILLWVHRDVVAPLCSATAAAPPPQQQAPVDCAMYIYADAQQKPTKLIDHTSCPTAGGNRAFLVDKGYKRSSFPKLLEVAPLSDHKFLCKAKRPCTLVITGYGLEQEDRLILVHLEDSDSPASCPPEEHTSRELQHHQEQQQVHATRHIRTSSKMAYDHSIRPQTEHTIMTVFELGQLEEGVYLICYSTSRSLPKQKAQLKDFHYKAGSLAVEREPRYVCDFEEDVCDLMVYRDHMDMDLFFRRDSGATETPGTGPSFDHTLGPQQRGHYIYMDSPGYLAGASATMIGRPAVYPAGLYCVRFFYHMWGDDVNSLRMYMHALQHDDDITGDWGKPQLLRIGDHGDEWLEGGFEFRSDGRTAQQLVIEALAGFSEKGDIALDDISLSAGRCEENIKRDAYQGDYICGEVRLVSGDWSEEKSWYVEGAVSCAGRGYSYDSLRGSWMPCCVPHYGDYTLVLHDGYGDGWSGSKMEFRFFEETQTFGEDFLGGEEGAEKKYTLNVGLVQLTRVEGSSDSIRLEVQVSQPQSYVWCGAALAASPAPTVEILKKYGIRSQNPTSAAGEKVLMEIKNKPNAARVLQPHTDYNIYCYAEPAAAASLAGSAPTEAELPQHLALQQELKQHQHSFKYMDDKQVAASRTPVTTDKDSPVITLKDVDVGTTSAMLHLHADEACTVYCLPVETGVTDTAVQPPSASSFKSKSGSKISILKGAEHVTHHLQLPNLSPDTSYRVFCYAEDRALPRPNTSSAEEVKATALDLQTPSKVPVLTITSYEAFVRGFRLEVMSDTPAKVWCAAAMSGSAYPKKEDVKRVGAKAEIQDIAVPATIEIRGVPPNTRYSIYCLGSSRSGSVETSNETMWAEALEVTSFGKFCEMPLTPPVLSEGRPTPFDPLTPAEEHLVRDFLRTQQHLNLEGVYRVNLYADKEAILNHYEKGAAFPPRYARVRAGSCDRGKGAFRQFKVGPLPDSQEAQAAAAGGSGGLTHRGGQQLQLEEIGKPVETDCGGYNPQGVFGRRLLAKDEEDSLDALLFDAFGIHFGQKMCKYEQKAAICAVHGPFIFKEGANGDLQEIWIGLKAFADSERLKQLRGKSEFIPQRRQQQQTGDLHQVEAESEHREEQRILQKQQTAQCVQRNEQGSLDEKTPDHEKHDSAEKREAHTREVLYLPFYFVAFPPASLRKFDTVSSILLPESSEYVAQLLTEIKAYWMNGLLFHSLEELRGALASKKYPQLSPEALQHALKGPSRASSPPSGSEKEGNQKQQQRRRPQRESQPRQEQDCGAQHSLQQGLPREQYQQHSNQHEDTAEYAAHMSSLWGATAVPLAPVSSFEPSFPPQPEPERFSPLPRQLEPRLPPTGLLATRLMPTGIFASRQLKSRRLASQLRPATRPKRGQVSPVVKTFNSQLTNPRSSVLPTTNDLLAAWPTISQVSVSLPTRRLSAPLGTGSSGTGRTWPGPDPRGRGGLEYRAGPEHIEPQGKRYTIKHSPSSTSYTIEYLGWSMTVTNDRDTSLRIWNLRFNGERYAFELGVNEALAHYSVAERHWYFMDSWYGGLGAAARRVHAGIECTKTATILFFDQSLCVFEQDKARPLRSHWKAGVLRDAAPHYVLVLRQIITVSNYDYITDYAFHASGVFEATMAFTGELYAGVEVPWFSARQAHHGTQVTGSMRMGALHAHLASWKVDFDLDNYKENSVLWEEVKKDPARPGALRLDKWIAETEQQAYFKFNDTRPLHYQVIHEDHKVYGNLGGLTVLPLPTIAVRLQEEAETLSIPNPDFELFTGPAAWAKYRILTTLRKEEEYYGSLPRDNKYALRPAVSLDRFIQDNDKIRRKDVVTWVASAVWHIPVIEDMPQTLSLGNTLGFMVKPHNFFTEDVSMDLHNALGGAVQDPGTCAIIRQELEKFLSE